MSSGGSEEVMCVNNDVVDVAPPCVVQDMQNARNVRVVWHIQLRLRPGPGQHNKRASAQSASARDAAAAASALESE